MTDPGYPEHWERDASGRERPATRGGPTWVDRAAWYFVASMLRRGRVPKDREVGAFVVAAYDIAEALKAERDRRYPEPPTE